MFLFQVSQLDQLLQSWRSHTQHPPVSQTSQGVQEKVCAAVGEQVLGVALLVVQRTEQHAGPPQLSGADGGASVSRVSADVCRQQQNLAILTELLLIQREGGELPKPVTVLLLGERRLLCLVVCLSGQQSGLRHLVIFPLEKAAVFSVSTGRTGIKPPAFLHSLGDFLKQQSRTMRTTWRRFPVVWKNNFYPKTVVVFLSHVHVVIFTAGS